MLKKILKYTYFFLLIVTPLVMYGKTSELFEFNKMLIIYLSAASTLFILTIYWFLYRVKPHVRSLFDIPILLFIVSQILSTLFSIDQHTSLFGYYGRFNGGLLSIFSYVILYYGYIFLLSQEEKPIQTIIQTLQVSLVASFITILWAIPGKFGHDLSCLVFVGEFSNGCWTAQFNPAVRVFSTLGQPNWFGAYLAVHFFFALFFLIKDYEHSRYKVSKIIFGIYLVMNFYFLLYTRSRSAIGAVGFGIIAFILYYIWFCKKNKMKFSKYFIIVLIVLGLFVVIFKTGIDKLDRYLLLNTYTNVFQKKHTLLKPTVTKNEKPQYGGVTDSLDIRKIVWSGATELGKQYFLFGTGVETFAYSYYFVRPKEHNLTSEWDFLYNKAHNEYLNYFATTGLFGLVTYIGIHIIFFVMLFRAFIRATNVKEHQLLLVAVLLSYMSIILTNFFGFSTTTINVFFYLVPAIPAFFLYVSNEQKKIEKTVINPIYYAIVALPYMFIVVFLLNYWVSDIKYALADVYVKMNEYESGAILLNQALSSHYEHVYEDKLSNAYANLAFIASYQRDKTKALSYMQQADELNKKSINASPSNIIYLKTTAKNDYLFFQITLDRKYIEDGVNALQKAKLIAPSDSKITYYLAMYYSILADESSLVVQKKQILQQALTEIDNSLNQKPDYIDSYVMKVQILKKIGNKSEAKKTAEFALKQFDPKHSILLKEIEGL